MGDCEPQDNIDECDQPIENIDFDKQLRDNLVALFASIGPSVLQKAWKKAFMDKQSRLPKTGEKRQQVLDYVDQLFARNGDSVADDDATLPLSEGTQSTALSASTSTSVESLGKSRRGAAKSFDTFWNELHKLYPPHVFKDGGLNIATQSAVLLANVSLLFETFIQQQPIGTSYYFGKATYAQLKKPKGGRTLVASACLNRWNSTYFVENWSGMITLYEDCSIVTSEEDFKDRRDRQEQLEKDLHDDKNYVKGFTPKNERANSTHCHYPKDPIKGNTIGDQAKWESERPVAFCVYVVFRTPSDLLNTIKLENDVDSD